MKAFASTPSQMSLFDFLFNLLFFLSPLFGVQCPFKSFVYQVSLWIYLPAQHRQYSSTPLYSLCPRIGQEEGPVG